LPSSVTEVEKSLSTIRGFVDLFDSMHCQLDELKLSVGCCFNYSLYRSKVGSQRIPEYSV
jgi:hypothetical protein